MARKYRVISGDSHVEVDSKHWAHRVPQHHRQRMPRLLRMATGGDAWVIEGRPAREPALDLYGGKGRENWGPTGQTYESTAGTGSGEQRVREQERGGIDGEVMFPSQQGGANLWRYITDDEPYKAVVRGYNDWLAEEYCSVAPDRLIGLGVLPMTNLDDCIAEMEHCAKLGLSGVVLGTFPSNKGYPTPEDDKFWAASLDLKMPITAHIEFNREGERAGSLLKFPNEDRRRLGGSGIAEQVSRYYRAGGLNVVQLVLDGLFERFPNLKVFFAETQAGWIPFFMKQADIRYQRHVHWAQEIQGFKPLKALPTEYMREHIYWGFQEDATAIEMRHHMRADRIIWATDFPHQESDWPEDGALLDRIFEGCDEEDRYKISCGNVIDFFHLDAE